MAFTLIKDNLNIDFIGFRKVAYVLTLIALLIGLGAMIMNRGLHYGVDFAGGIMVQVQFEDEVQDSTVKKALSNMNMKGLMVQKIGDDDKNYMLRFSSTDEHSSLRTAVISALNSAIPNNDVSIERIEMVGPKVGADLRNMAIEALFYSILLITVYISGRFENSWFIASGIAVFLWGGIWIMDTSAQYLDIGFFNKMYAVSIGLVFTIFLCWKLKLNFALGALIALIHDVVITLGILTLFGKEIDLNVIAALLTLVGYSLNDNIVIYDRIRENLRLVTSENKMNMGDVINQSVNQTLSRTIMTSATTIFACLSLYILGGSVIHDFAFTMLIGVVVGTFSSIFVASPILLAFGDVEIYARQQAKEDEMERPGEHGVV